MTIEDVKRELPMILVRWQGHTYWGRVTGRLNKFASVSPYDKRAQGKIVKTIMGPIYEVAWEAVTRAANEGKPVNLD